MKDKIIAKVKSLMKKVTHKYGLEVPMNVKHTCELYKISNNMLWAYTINKEIKNVRVAFDVKEKET